MRLFEITINSAEFLQKINKYVNEFMPILAPGLPKPEIKIINNKKNFLGKTLFDYRIQNGEEKIADNTKIEIQSSLASNDDLLRRVVAHELCHHQDLLLNVRPEMVKNGVWTFHKFIAPYRDGHGKEWQAIANIFNSKFGKDFVTKISDTMVDELSEYYLLIRKESDVRYLNQQAVRLSNEKIIFLRNIIFSDKASKFKLVKTNSGFFSSSCPIGDTKYSVAVPEGQIILKNLWHNGKDLLHEVVPTTPTFEVKPYYLLIIPQRDRFIVQRSVNLSPKQLQYLNKRVNLFKSKCRLFKVNNGEFSTAPLIGSKNLMIPDSQDIIQKIWDNNEDIMGHVINRK
jgi:hypothetical protein